MFNTTPGVDQVNKKIKILSATWKDKGSFMEMTDKTRDIVDHLSLIFKISTNLSIKGKLYHEA